MEVAQRESDDIILGTSTDINRFYFDENGDYLVAKGSTVRSGSIPPIVTVIRGISTDICCKRSSYTGKTKIDKANRIDKENADGTFVVIRKSKSSKNDYK
jgi:hypothetical protein